MSPRRRRPEKKKGIIMRIGEGSCRCEHFSAYYKKKQIPRHQLLPTTTGGTNLWFSAPGQAPLLEEHHVRKANWWRNLRKGGR